MAARKRYKKLEIIKGTRWWIQYWYRVPADVAHLYQNKRWWKFRVFEDINRHKTDEYAQMLLRATKYGLDNGFNPFEYEKQAREAKAKAEADRIAEEKRLLTLTPAKRVKTCMDAFNYFFTEWNERGLEQATISKLKRAESALVDYLRQHNLQHEPITIITKDIIKAALREASHFHGWSNRTFNNNKTALSTIFLFLVDEEIIPSNPVKSIVPKKTISRMHQYYDEDEFERVRTVSERDDPLTHFALKLVYYLCLRAEKELKHFKVGNIFLDRRQVLIQGEDAKTDADRFVDIPDELVEELTYIRKNYPGHFYVVGKGTRVKHVRDNTPSPKPFPQNMISARFRKIRAAAGLTSRHTPYGMKHTRVIHLKLDGAKDQDIMKITGHTSYEAFAQYMRDLGMEGDPKAIRKINRKF